ncbi:hypothetical protein PoB_002314100 [Plakobranchus ocellatus]|uniref:Uncharacterized protein n=1 Tax=Plakobranchus ocellatus TaxID=259542 RepID=A0AAV3ZBJ8_9GAST|nr:hypothetical protein PoB_002314100 [Plakobranchus ocellatus]
MLFMAASNIQIGQNLALHSFGQPRDWWLGSMFTIRVLLYSNTRLESWLHVHYLSPTVFKYETGVLAPCSLFESYCTQIRDWSPGSMFTI